MPEFDLVFEKYHEVLTAEGVATASEEGRVETLAEELEEINELRQFAADLAAHDDDTPAYVTRT